MSDSLKKHVFQNLGSRVLFMFFQGMLILILPILTSPATYGLISILLVNANFAVLLTSGGVPSLLANVASKSSPSLTSISQILKYSSIIQLVIICAAEAVSVFIHDSFLIWPSNSYVTGFSGILLVAGISYAEKLSGIYTGFLKAHLYYARASIIGATQMVLLLLWLAFETPGPETIPIYLLISGQLALVILLQAAIIKGKFWSAQGSLLSSFDLKSSWLFAFPVYLSNLIQFLALRVDIWLVGYWLGIKQVGFYALSNQLGQILMILPMVLASLVFPLLNSGKMETKSFERWIRLMNAILWIVLLLGFILSPIIIRAIWNNLYNDSIIPFLWTLPGFFARAQIAMYTAFFSARGHVKLNVVASIIGLICLLFADAFLLPAWNIEGAAIGLSIAQIITAGWMIRIFNKKTGSSGSRVLPDRRDLQGIDLSKWINRFRGRLFV